MTGSAINRREQSMNPDEPSKENTCLRADTHRQAQARFAEDLAFILKPVPGSATAGDWGPVYGELLTFDDPSTRLPAIDRLKGFHPGGSSMYRRVLAPALTGETVVPVWLYVGDEIIKRRLAPLGKSRWL